MKHTQIVFLLFLFNVHTVFGQATQDEIAEKRLNALEVLKNQNVSTIEVDDNKNTYSFLSMQEKELILLLQEDYKKFFDILEYNERFFNDIDYKRMIYLEDKPSAYKYVEPPPSDKLNNYLQELFQNQIQTIYQSIASADLSLEQRSFLTYYISYTMYQFDTCNSNNQIEAIDKGKAFVQNYPNSEHLPFIKKYTGSFKNPTNKGVELAVLGGLQFYQEQLGEKISNAINLGLSAGGSYKRFTANLQLNLGLGKVKDPFFYHINYEKNRPLRLIHADLQLGYFALISKRISISSFIGPQINSLVGMKYADEPLHSANFRNITGFALNYGVNIDINFSQDSCNQPLENIGQKVRKSGYFIRLQLAHSSPSFHNTVASLDGRMFLLNIGIGHYGVAIEKTPVFD